jgi:hypothetical protein
MAAVMASFLTAWLIEDLAGLHTAVVVLAVVLALSVGRAHRPTDRRGAGLAGLLLLPLVAAVSGGIGTLMVRHAAVGDALFSIVLAGAIWVRRFGPGWTRAGTLATLPFIALLVAPAAPRGSVAATLWTLVIAAVAVGWVWFTSAAARLAGLLPRSNDDSGGDESRDDGPSEASPTEGGPTEGGPSQVGPTEGGPSQVGPSGDVPGAAPPDGGAAANGRAGSAASPSGGPRAASARSRRLSASSRMAAQMGIGLGLAFAVGHLAFGEHWPWLVLTAYIVAAGNRGRADVLYKAGLRVAGAAAGTVAATLIGGLFAPGNRWAIAALFAVVGIASWLRNLSYAYWAASVTAALSLLYAYEGQSGEGVLLDRLGAILCGAALAIAFAWFVLPVRSLDVLRRRLADAMAALSGWLTAARRRQTAALPGLQRQFDAALVQLEQIAPPHAAYRGIASRLRTRAPHLADAIPAARDAARAVRLIGSRAAAEPGYLAAERVAAGLAGAHGHVTAARGALKDRRPDVAAELTAAVRVLDAVATISLADRDASDGLILP